MANGEWRMVNGGVRLSATRAGADAEGHGCVGRVYPRAVTEQLRRLVYDHLSHESVRFPGKIEPGVLFTAALEHGLGLAHLDGEQLLAVIDESQYLQAGTKVMGLLNDSIKARRFSGMLITDRRIIGGDPCLAIPLTDIVGARTSGRLIAKVEVLATRGSQTFELEAAPQIAALLTAMISSIPDSERVGVRRPLCAPSSGDPLGINHIYDGQAVDGRVTSLLGLASLFARAGEDGLARGRDLAWRAMLLQKTAALGRGSHGGSWLSPLHRGDFAGLLPRLFGRPTQAWTDPQGGWGFEFVVEESVAAATMKSAVGLLAGALIGVGGVVLPKRSAVRVVCWELGQFTAFTLVATTGLRGTKADGEDLRQREWAHTMLAAHEGRTILLRAIYGWQHPLDALLAADPRAVLAHVTEHIGTIDLSAFFPEVPADQMIAISPEIAAIMAEVESKSLDDMKREAHEAWRAAQEAGTVKALSRAALGFQHVSLFDESIAAYRELAQRHPAEASEAWQGIGDSYLHRADMGASEDLARDFEAALHAYDQAMLDPQVTHSYLEHNYWEATSGLAKQRGGEEARRVLSRYVERFPTGEHRPEATKMLGA